MTKDESKTTNSFERHGRAVKVGKLLAGIDRILDEVMPGASDERAAEWLASLPAQDRGRVAVLAGVKPPSDETWAAFVAAVRTRKTDPDFAAEVIS